MSFTDDEVGIETYDGVTQLLFPHPPVILDRFEEGAVARDSAVTISGRVTSVQWAGAQAKRSLRILVRRLTAAQMATLGAIRDAVGLVRVKLSVGTSTTVLCSFDTDKEQRWKPMIADHPETDEIGDDPPAVFLVYEAEIALLRME